MGSRIYKIIKESGGNHLLKYKQFTIDLVESLDEIVEDDDVNEETMAGCISYKIDTALEIMNQDLDDYAFLKGLLEKIQNEYRPNMEDIEEIKGMFENGFFVNTGVTEFIDAVLSAPGNLIGIGKLEEPITLNRGLCIGISGLFYINTNISDAPMKDKYFYVNTGLLSFIHRILKVGFGTEIQMTDARTKKDYLLEVSKHPLICSVITKISAASEE